jgi:internalin A
MSRNHDGLTIARERIAEEAGARTGSLDLGRLGLGELPAELLALTHLRHLILGNGYQDGKGNWIEAISQIAPNRLDLQLHRLAALPDLRMLSVNGAELTTLTGVAQLRTLQSLDCSDTEVGDLSPVSGLSALQSLDCSRTAVSDLSPVSGLSALRSLHCWRTQVRDLSPVTRLSALQSLDCSDTEVSDLSPVSGLSALQSLDCSDTEVSDLSPVSGLSALQSLDCSGTPVSDLSPLRGLSALQSLNSSRTRLSDLSQLRGLSALQSLNCSGTPVSDLSPVRGLSALQSLDCSVTPVSDLSPLLGLSALQSLNCLGTQVSDLSPLSGLGALQSIDCPGTPVSDLSPLSGLSALQSLNCSVTEVNDLSPLRALSALQSLDCSWTPVSDLSPVSGLIALQSLNCSETPVSDLSPLHGLSALQSLDCSRTQVRDLSPLSGLSALQSLDCSRTQVSDLSPLYGLSALQSLNCSQCALEIIPQNFWQKSSLREVYLFETKVPGIPVEVMSQGRYTSCLDSLRSHLSDLKAGAVAVPDVKLMVLGNGRVGKTQICRRLRDEDYDPRVPSTHGVIVTSTSLAESDGGQPAILHIWDFGGQDIYHGTHALFMRTRAVFLIVWTPEGESSREHAYEGILFRNHPLPYWIDTVRHLGAPNSPVLIVQSRCDRLEDDVHRLPAPPELLAALPHWELQYSAFNNRRRATLNEALREAVARVRELVGEMTIGAGRLKVKQRLEQLRDADAAEPPEQRQYRTITQEHFRQLCDEAGGITAPEHLLSYLHNCGIVFYRPALFDDRIILDQAWALEAIYAVFNRENCYRPLRHLRGRFTRPILEALVWREYNTAEQEVFLGMMLSCGICFIHRRGSPSASEDDEYIAPDLLPQRGEIQAELDAMWDADAPVETAEFEYVLLHPGMVRSVISRIGSEAGVTALYWRGGLCVYETTTRSRALIEQEMADEWRGKIAIHTQRGQATELLRRLSVLVRDESARMGAEPVNASLIDRTRPPLDASPTGDERAGAEAAATLTIQPRARRRGTIFRVLCLGG